MSRTDVYLQTEDAMTLDQRSAFLDRVFEINPHLRGAEVADVLDMFDNADSNLDVVEPFFIHHRDQIPATQSTYYSSALRALLWAGEFGPGGPDWESVDQLTRRAIEGVKA
jgi:hypothetical protein